MPNVHKLSKSQYCKGRKCLKRVWLYNNRRELAYGSPAEEQAPGSFQAHLFEQGHKVGTLARTLFPNGVLIEEDHTQSSAAIEKTREQLDAGAKVLFEAAIVFDNVLIRIDVMRVQDDGSVDLIEVKSSNSVKEDHLVDVALQKYVLEGAGFTVNECILMHLNPDYVRAGDLEVEGLFILATVNDQLKKYHEEVVHYLKLIRAKLASEEEPPSEIGSKCKSPYRCEFYNHCWSHITADSIQNLTRLSPKQRIALKKTGVENIKDIPDDFELTVNQMIQRKCALSGETHVELSKIKSFIESLRWPLYFLDFETVQFAIPRMDGTSPYQQLPFQYSLHIQKEPGGTILHKDFLSTTSADPRKEFVTQLCSDIPINDGSVVVYYAPFERSIIENLSETFGKFDHHLQDIADRLWDLETPFGNRWVYKHSFEGKSSIKTVLPALIPNLSYDDLKIQKGDVAQAQYQELITALNSVDRERMADELRAYCERDTWAMVQILRTLFEIVGKERILPKSA